MSPVAAAPPERGDAAAAAPAPVAGLDGCRRGWVLALLDPAGRLCVEVHDRFADAMAAGVGAGSVIIGADIPIGLPVDGRRLADVEARRLLGARRSSVFPTPCRAVLGAADYAEALVQSRAASGKGLSKQAWNLVPKMREVDQWVTPSHEARLHEVHPELAFARLAGGPLAEPKRSPAGAAARRRLLAGRLGRGVLAGALEQVGPGVATDDVLDAVAVALSARSIAAGEGITLGDGARDERGLVMRICA
ncbi:MAG: DUF429 domain-containing protein [Acidimicrobiia bacterium]